MTPVPANRAAARRRMRSVGITLGLTALVAASLTGCSNGDDEDQSDYQAICVDPETQQRADDDECKDDREYNGSGAGFFWFYMATRGGAFVPPLGGRYNTGDGSYNTAGLRNGSGGTATIKRGGLDTKGGNIGTISRGGFGKAGKGSSGG